MKAIRSRTVLLHTTALVTIVLLFTCSSVRKSKDDVVIMENGDRFTGEIKGLQHGELIFKSEYMEDSVHLDWKKVKLCRAKTPLLLVLAMEGV